MSHKNDDENAARALPGEDGQMKPGRRTYLGVLVASQLARARRLWAGGRAGSRDPGPVRKERRP